MNKKMLATLAAASFLFAGCADLTESQQFGVDTVGKSAQSRLKENRGMRAQEACAAEVDALPKEQLEKYNRDEVIDGCVRANTSDEG